MKLIVTKIQRKISRFSRKILSRLMKNLVKMSSRLKMKKLSVKNNQTKFIAKHTILFKMCIKK